MIGDGGTDGSLDLYPGTIYRPRNEFFVGRFSGAGQGAGTQNSNPWFPDDRRKFPAAGDSGDLYKLALPDLERVVDRHIGRAGFVLNEKVIPDWIVVRDHGPQAYRKS
jgi:hypothetical protein